MVQRNRTITPSDSRPPTRSTKALDTSLVVAAGASHSYFGKDEFAEYAPGMKTIEDARYLRDGILSKFEMAEMATDPAERAEWLTFVVIGAGPTGVELAGQLAELAHIVLARSSAAARPGSAPILAGVDGHPGAERSRRCACRRRRPSCE